MRRWRVAQGGDVDVRHGSRDRPLLPFDFHFISIQLLLLLFLPLLLLLLIQHFAATPTTSPTFRGEP